MKAKSKEEAILITDHNYEIIGWDKYAKQLYGYSEDEIIGNKIFKIIPIEYQKTFLNILKNAYYSEMTDEVEGLRLNKKGEIFYVNSLIKPLKDEETGEITFAIYETDVTNRVNARTKILESEEKYRKLIENLCDGILLLDNKFNIALANPAFQELMEIKSLNLHNVPLENIIEKEVFKKIVDYAKELNKKNVVRFETNLRIDNNIKTVDITTIPVKSIKNQLITGFILIFRDITSNKKVKEELIKAARLETTEKIAGGIAHDFNNILTIILGNISLLKISSDVTDKILKRIEKIEKASLRARELTQKLMTFTRSGEPIKKITSVKKAIIESVSLTSAGTSITIDVDIQKDLWGAEIDEEQIIYVLNNLLVNAQQAMTPGGKVLVKAENFLLKEKNDKLFELQPGKYIKITVKDNGPGIPSDILDHIFEPYFTTKDKKHGLGLSTSYIIVKRHNGTIKVESEHGKGTAFYIYLPSIGKYIESEEEKPDHFYKGEGKILIMDDEEEIREMAGIMLQNIGYKVDFAADGEEAIRKYKKQMMLGKKFDAVILDLTVPGGMGGKETITELLKIDPDVKAIVSSGYSNDPIMTKYKQHGFSGVVRKPYRPLELGKVIKKIISKK